MAPPNRIALAICVLTSVSLAAPNPFDLSNLYLGNIGAAIKSGLGLAAAKAETTQVAATIVQRDVDLNAYAASMAAWQASANAFVANGLPAGVPAPAANTPAPAPAPPAANPPPANTPAPAASLPTGNFFPAGLFGGQPAANIPASAPNTPAPAPNTPAPAPAPASTPAGLNFLNAVVAGLAGQQVAAAAGLPSNVQPFVAPQPAATTPPPAPADKFPWNGNDINPRNYPKEYVSTFEPGGLNTIYKCYDYAHARECTGILKRGVGEHAATPRWSDPEPEITVTPHAKRVAMEEVVEEV